VTVTSYAQVWLCDTCGHFASEHADRVWDGGLAPCGRCACEDFQSEGADEAGGLAGRVDLEKLERLLDVPAQDLTGFVPALIERVREAETERDKWASRAGTAEAAQDIAEAKVAELIEIWEAYLGHPRGQGTGERTPEYFERILAEREGMIVNRAEMIRRLSAESDRAQDAETRLKYIRRWTDWPMECGLILNHIAEVCDAHPEDVGDLMTEPHITETSTEHKRD
jgi:hypothetical protein